MLHIPFQSGHKWPHSGTSWHISHLGFAKGASCQGEKSNLVQVDPIPDLIVDLATFLPSHLSAWPRYGQKWLCWHSYLSGFCWKLSSANFLEGQSYLRTEVKVVCSREWHNDPPRPRKPTCWNRWAHAPSRWAQYQAHLLTSNRKILNLSCWALWIEFQ